MKSAVESQPYVDTDPRELWFDEYKEPWFEPYSSEDIDEEEVRP